MGVFLSLLALVISGLCATLVPLSLMTFVYVFVCVLYSSYGYLHIYMCVCVLLRTHTMGLIRDSFDQLYNRRIPGMTGNL